MYMKQGKLCDAAWNTCLHEPGEKTGVRRPFMETAHFLPNPAHARIFEPRYRKIMNTPSLRGVP